MRSSLSGGTTAARNRKLPPFAYISPSTPPRAHAHWEPPRLLHRGLPFPSVGDQRSSEAHPDCRSGEEDDHNSAADGGPCQGFAQE